MDKARAIEVLKQAANKNKTANDVFHDFALRERARSQVTVRALFNRMKKAGFDYTSNDYASVLKLMSECGFGELRTNKRGSIVGLFGVSTALQSIGQAVVGGKREPLRNYAPRNKYSPLPPSAEPIKVNEASSEKREILKALSGVDNLIRTILQDDSVPADRRVEAARALLQESKM